MSKRVEEKEVLDLRISSPIAFRKKYTLYVISRDLARFMGEEHVYGLRHPDNDWDMPATLEKFVLVNRYGFVFSPKKIEGLYGNKDGYFNLTRKERQAFWDAQAEIEL